MRTCIRFAEICASGLTVGAVLRIGIRCLFDPWIRDLGWVKKQDPDPESGSGELRNQLFGLEYLYYLMRIRDPGGKNSDPGSVMENIWIRDVYPGSATLS
jgi:hypothetical protein